MSEEPRRDRWERRTEWPLTALAVAFLMAYALPILKPDLRPWARTACELATWVAWAAFAVDYVTRLALSRRRAVFVRGNLLDLAVVVLPLLRPLRLLRLVTLLSVLNRALGGSLRGRVAVYVGGATALVLLVAALAILDAERQSADPNITSFGDALWWAALTAQPGGGTWLHKRVRQSPHTRPTCPLSWAGRHPGACRGATTRGGPITMPARRLLAATAAAVAFLTTGAGVAATAATAVPLVTTATATTRDTAAPALDAAVTLPSGFRLVDYPTGQAAYNLTNFAWLGDGGLLTSGKNGTITYLAPGSTTPRTVGKVPTVRALGDHGFLGFAPANDYATTGHIVVSYDKGDPAGTGFGMVEEWQATPPASPTSFTKVRTIVDGSAMSPQLTQVQRNHGIDTVVVAPDDTIYLSVGDDSLNNGDPTTLRAQDLDQPFGKVLHFTADGKAVPSNPFYSAASPASWRSMVYAYGFRNPFRFSLDPRSGVPHLGDVGWSTTEEINTLAPGTNAGWPCYEGAVQTTFSPYAVCQSLYAAGSARLPIWSYRHDESGQQMGAAIVGGIHYTGTTYPAAYRNAYFFGDYTRQRIWSMGTDLTGALTRAPETDGFADGIGGPSAFRTGPNGDITYADLLSSTVRRFVYQAGNRPPSAVLTSTTDADTQDVAFSAADSYDLDGDALTYSWSFGDGTTGTGVTVTHHYASADPVTVTVTVTDQLGATGTATATVYPANHTPVLTVNLPPAGTTYAVNDPVALSATATDVEDGPLTVTWETDLLHCPYAGSCHRHPDQDPVVGPSYSEPFTDHGADTTMLVTAHVADSKGAVATTIYEAKPTLRTVAVNSPVAVAINGVTTTSAQVVTGSSVQLAAPVTSTYRSFVSWSDGGASTHSITMPDSDLVLTASYRTAIETKYASLGGAGSFLGLPTTPEYDIAGGRARNYAGGRLYWSAATGAHEVHGAILNRYLAAGGAATRGFPTTDQQAVAGGLSVSFTKARIYWSSTTGARLLGGAILEKYLALGGPARLGLPTTDLVAMSGGYVARFAAGASIYYSSATGAHLVKGGILTKYLAAGGPAVRGFPTTDEVAVTGGLSTAFTKARIYWSSSTGAHVVNGAILAKYLALGGPAGAGLPMTDVVTVTGGWYTHFTGTRSVFYASATGAHLVKGGIRNRYAAMGYQRSCLGFPRTDEYAITGGLRNLFAGGSITYLYSTNVARSSC
ncbi:MAG: sugar dehydrogenase [Humibacillus sp.]|nr:sugar dehydrogenase [Humibacillus sp.]